MKMNLLSFFVLILGFTSCSSDSNEEVNGNITGVPAQINVDYETATQVITVTANREWAAYSNDTWITCDPKYSVDYEGVVTVTIAANTATSAREGAVVLKAGNYRVTVPVTQEAAPEKPVDPSIEVPEGYKLVWSDEFKSGDRPGDEWYYETGAGGWGNNELQHYVEGSKDNEQLAVVKDGTLKIIAKKIDNTVYSIRMNTAKSWKYGYFEARLKLPVGKGTWPAFWMMPKHFTAWPDDGEIDIMEHVGYRPNWASSAIHCKAYNHMNQTEKTGEQYVSTAQTEFHVYAMEWTEDFIEGFVDGKSHFKFQNDKKGNKDTWPFDQHFYLKLNLAWGGNWGGAQGVDESALPATYEIDYVRVFQKD